MLPVNIIMSSEKKSAEEYKGLGNEAFAKKDFKVAIECYTKAIQLEPTNHIFFSNRSASHSGLQEWDQAIKDSKECIRLKPEFIKGYYRLATAQMETKSYDAAEATIRQGLALEAENTQLVRVLRSVKLHKKATAAALSPNNTNTSSTAVTAGASSSNSRRQLDTATQRELHDLQLQYGASAREYNSVEANLNKASKEEKIYSITLSEVENNPSASGNYFRCVGKLFLRSTKPEVLDHLQSNIESQKKTQKELSGKREYLEKRLRSQQMNMKELSQ